MSRHLDTTAPSRALARSAIMIFLALPSGAFGRQGPPPASQGQTDLLTVHQIASIELPTINAAVLRTLAEARPEPGPYQVAEGVDLALGLGHGTWETVAVGRLWRLRIESPGAWHLNLGFGTFRLPPGATLHVTSIDRGSVWAGPYTARDNSPTGLWTPMLPGDSVVVEVFVPTAAELPELEITRAGLGFVDLFDLAPTRHELGACYIDAVCPAAFMNDVERGVVHLLIDNAFLCSGTLINDVGATRRPFVLTADHCEITAPLASTVVALFNFKTATCGSGTPGPQTDTVSGSTLRATRTDVDGALIELNSMPPGSYQVFYVGWDRSNVAPSGTSGLHHPQGTSMAFSDDTQPPVTVNNCIGGGGINSHWDVDWNQGATAMGSSGSGLFDRNSRKVIGFLSGGSSQCNGAATEGCCDCYGKFSTFWDGPSSASRLRDWLDPGNTGTMMVSGIEGAVTTRNLTVTKTGTGTGTVTSSPPGINCGGTCDAGFADGSPVTLTAQPGAGGMVFAGWGGACAASGTSSSCLLTMDADKAVSASFDPPDPCTLAIDVTCSETYSGTTVGATHDFGNYSCTADPQAGTDVLHTVTPVESGNVTVDLDNLAQDLDLFALSVCDADNCVTSSESGGATAEQVTFAATAGITYRIVVEDYNSVGTTYDLTATCPCTAPQGPSQDLFGVTVSDTQTRQVCYLFRTGQGTQVSTGGDLTIRAQKIVFLNDFTVAGELSLRND